MNSQLIQPAYQALFLEGGMKKGSNVLIHAVSGSAPSKPVTP